jgi:rhodanese-related sulfurtransferase
MSNIAQLRPAEFDTWVKAHADALPVLLDVREPWELQTASVKPVPGFRLVTVPMNDIPTRLAELDPDVPVACLCHHGARSQRVAMFLAGNGFVDVTNLAGGIDAWSVEHDGSVPRY